MKTYSNLFDKITEWDNLLLAARKASQGRRFEPPVARFHFRLESELLRLQQELQTKTYRPGSYTTFMVYDPKERMISAAPFRDRVVHHALCNVMEPIFEKTFVHDSFANRKGKGTHRAIERYQYYARRYRYVLKSDIRKFFPSLDHEILKREFRWKIACLDTLWLADLILDNSNEQEPGGQVAHLEGVPHLSRRGLPIGNLTSQFWANVYLNRFDHFVKEELGVAGYVRYVDDFVLFSNNKQELAQCQIEITKRLSQLRLVPHPDKTHIHRTATGVPFLGFRVWSEYRIAKKERVRRFERYLRNKMQDRPLDTENLDQGLNSWLGHVRFGQSQRLEYRVFWCQRNAGVNVLKHPRGSWRVL
ncbi:MAG: reverse transcriptase domain-containing protein [Saprospiraceae bacterium]